MTETLEIVAPPVMNGQQPSKTLIFKDKHISINLPTLKASARYENARGGLPSTRPLEHWAVIEEVKKQFVEIVGLQTNSMTEFPIFAYEGASARLNWAGREAELCPTENYLIGRILTKISFPHINGENNEQDQTIAIGYHEKGIDIAFGPNIRICSNLNIFGGKLLSTYGSKGNSTPWDKMIEVVKSWFHDFTKHEQEDYMTIQRLKSIKLSYEDIVTLIGKAYINARAHNKGLVKGAWMSESTVGRLTDFVRSEETQIETAWDLTQAGTNLLKAGTGGDLMTLLKVNKNFNDFIIENTFSEN